MCAEPYAPDNNCGKRHSDGLDSLRKPRLGAHSVATRVMITNVATCMMPVTPAV